MTNRVSLRLKVVKYYEEKFIRIATIVLIFTILIIMPLITTSDYILNIIIRFCVLFGLIASWNILSGYTRYINFGLLAFYGLAAYVSGIAINYYNLPIWIALPLGIIASILLSIIIGSVSLRLSGTYFAIATLITLLMMATIFSNLRDFIQSPTSEIWLPLILTGSSRIIVFYYIFLSIFAFTLILNYSLEKTRLGFILKAIGSDENEAAKLGINPAIEKFKAFLIGSIIVGIIGGLHALYLAYIDVPVVLSTLVTFLIVYIAIIGGIGIWFGTLLGVLIYIPMDELLTLMTANPLYSRLLYGIVFIFIMFFIPDGVGGYIYKKVKFKTTGR